MIYENIPGVPRFECEQYATKQTKFCLLIPVINEGERILNELKRAQKHGIDRIIDILLCDGNSTDGSTDSAKLKQFGVNTLLIKHDEGGQGAQLRMGIFWALDRGYDGIITIDGNNKDSIEDMPHFIEKLNEGYDFVQGSRFVKGGKAFHTPMLRYLAIRLLHAPIISLTAGELFTDTTNAYRAYSRKYLLHPHVQPLRDVFMTYELLAYLSVRASQLKLKTCEIPVSRIYPSNGKIPTSISFFRGNINLVRILFKNIKGDYKI